MTRNACPQNFSFLAHLLSKLQHLNKCLYFRPNCGFYDQQSDIVTLFYHIFDNSPFGPSNNQGFFLRKSVFGVKSVLSVAAASSKRTSSGKIAKFAPQLRCNHLKLEWLFKKHIVKHIVSEHCISCWLINYVNNLFLTCCSFRKRHFENWKFSFWNILTLH